MSYQGYNTELPLSASGYLLIPMAVRERHLSPEVLDGRIEAQAIGTHLQLTIPSKNEDIQIHIPLEEWDAGKPYKRAVNDWRVHAKRWKDVVMRRETDDGTVCPAQVTVLRRNTPKPALTA